MTNQVNNQRHKYHPLTAQYHNDSEDDDRSRCRNVSHCHQQFFSELNSPDDHTTQTINIYLQLHSNAWRMQCMWFYTPVYDKPKIALPCFIVSILGPDKELLRKAANARDTFLLNVSLMSRWNKDQCCLHLKPANQQK